MSAFSKTFVQRTQPYSALEQLTLLQQRHLSRVGAIQFSGTVNSAAPQSKQTISLRRIKNHVLVQPEMER
jgi:spore germination cell wall hydrolase CwlJ-like protein